MNREEALEILGFNKDDNPSRDDIRKVYLKLVLNVHSDKQVDKSIDVQKENLKRCQLVNPAYEFLIGKNAEEVTNLINENLEYPFSGVAENGWASKIVRINRLNTV